MSQNITVVLPEQLHEKLEAVKQETGLTKSEISRRGIIKEIQDLTSNEK